MLLELNQDNYRPGDFLSLKVGVATMSSAQPRADVYLVLALPDGTFFCLRGEDLAFGPPNVPRPLLRDWQITGVPMTTVLSLELPAGMTPGIYQWWLVLVKPGTAAVSTANWLDSRQLIWEMRSAAAGL